MYINAILIQMYRKVRVGDKLYKIFSNRYRNAIALCLVYACLAPVESVNAIPC
jgi:hypothetical protein